MKALRYAQNGAPNDVISIADVPLPEPPPGTVRIRLTRSPIHNHDIMTVSGHYGLKPPLPATAGSEMLGIVANSRSRSPASTRSTTTRRRSQKHNVPVGLAKYCSAPNGSALERQL